MSNLHRRPAPSYRAILAAALLAGAATSAFAADTVQNIPVGGSSFFILASPAAGDTYTVNNLGTVGFNFDGFGAISGSGAGTVVVNNGGLWWGPLDFTSATGPVTFNNTSGLSGGTFGWRGSGATVLGAGNDRIFNAETGQINTGTSSYNFGAGNDSLVNEGRFVGQAVTISGLETLDNAGTFTVFGNGTFGFGGAADSLINSGEMQFTNLTVTGLETFENSGTIQLGGRLIALGADYTGSGEGRIALDANLSATGQATCTGVVAGCLDFTGGSTAGSTLLAVRDVGANDAGSLNTGIVLVVGSSAAGDFILDPTSEHYVARTSGGPALQKGLVAYRLVYDDAGDRHLLAGVLADEAVQSATWAASAHETWRATTGSWLTRQADMRATPGGLESSAGLWARGGFSSSERDVAISATQLGASYDYDASYKQRVSHLVFGADLVTGASQGGAFVVGGMLGMARSDTEYEATPTEIVSTGFAGGLYGSYLAGPLFVDAIVSGAWMGLDAEVINLGTGEGVNISGDMKSTGVQVEAGWRVDLGGGLHLEPLVTAAYVKTEFENVEVPGGSGAIQLDDTYTSSRLGAGLRGVMDTQLMGVAASLSLTGRYWNEGDGEGAATILINSGATETPVTDDFSGAFSEIAASLNLFSSDGGVSGFASAGGKFADGYSAVEASVGVRMAW